MKTILAAIDYSPVSSAVLENAIGLARATDGSVTIVNVVQPPPVATDLAPLVGGALEFTAELERASDRHLRRIQSRWSKSGVKVDTICRRGSAVPLIDSLARQLGAAYIVVGSHGHSAFYDLVVGSTTSGVLKRAPCPVVVVPAARNKGKGRKPARRKS